MKNIVCVAASGFMVVSVFMCVFVCQRGMCAAAAGLASNTLRAPQWAHSSTGFPSSSDGGLADFQISDTTAQHTGVFR